MKGSYLQSKIVTFHSCSYDITSQLFQNIAKRTKKIGSVFETVDWLALTWNSLDFFASLL